jgi:PAS domain S-box-containing protein
MFNSMFRRSFPWLEKALQTILPGQLPLNLRLFRLVTFACSVLCLFVFWPANLFEHSLPKAIIFLTIGLGLLSLAIFRATCRGRHYFAVFLAAMILVLDLIWFLNGGINSGISLFYPPAMTLPLVFYRDRRRWLAAGLIVMDFCALILLSVWFPAWVLPFDDPAERLLDTTVSVLWSFLALAVIVWIIILGYDYERRAIMVSERKYRQLFENMTVGFALVESTRDDQRQGGDFRFLEVNPAFERLTGMAAATVTGRSIQEIEPGPEGNWMGFLEGVSRSGKSCARLFYSRRFGRYFDSWIFRSAPGQCAIIFSDVTERIQADEKIREQARLIDAANDAIILRDLNGVIQMWNRGAEAIYGWKAAEAVGRSPVDLGIYGAQEFQSHSEHLIKHGEWSGEVSALAKDGRRLEIASRWTPLCDEQGHPRKVLAISHDVTAHKQIEAQLFRAERLQTIGTLASGVAHDLNNILAPLLAGLPILREDAPHEEMREMIDLMEESVKRGADVVKQLLLFGRGGDEKRLPINPACQVRDVVKMIQQTFPKNITLKANYPADLRQVLADPTQIYQVLLNLAVNARDAMPEGGQLTLAAENTLVGQTTGMLPAGAKPGWFVQITVSDTGCGMTPDLMNRMFEPFFTTKEIGKGTGLGLSVVVGVVDNHGGFVKVKSTVGQGSEFRIYLPALSAPAEGSACGQASRPVGGSGELILVVDDESAVLRIGCKTLERHGYRALGASNGASALKLYAENASAISAVVSDYSMPGMDGLALADALWKIEPQARIILASGLGENLEAAGLAAHKVHGLLKKPFTTECLLTELQKVLSLPAGQITS